MKCRLLRLGLLGLCAWMLSALCCLANSPAASRNPYLWIAHRNVFGLRPPSTNHVTAPAPPMPKVILTGITTIFGDQRALLKVQFPAKPPKPAQEKDLVLAVGQHDGPIELLAVDAKTSHVKVSNSGTVSDITFEKQPPKPTAPPQPAVATLARPRWPRIPTPVFGRRY